VSDALVLPIRKGQRPETTTSLPHSQLTQHGPESVVAQLRVWCFDLPHVREEPSGISVPGTRALVLEAGVPANQAAFMVGREFAHIHPPPDNGSLHVQLPAEDAAIVHQQGWGEPHYLVVRGRLPPGLPLVFSPRDNHELEVVKSIVRSAHRFARSM